MKIQKFTTDINILTSFFVILIFTCIGNASHFILGEMIGMADNYYYFNHFYPSQEFSTTVSVYPFGTSLIPFVLLTLGINGTLAEITLIIAAILVFISVILFLKFIRLYDSYNKHTLPLLIIYALILCQGYISYSLTLKPDIVAYLFCFLGLYFFEKEKSLKSIIFGSLLISLSCLFKQHSVSFVLGLLLFSIINYKKKNVLSFGLISFIGYCVAAFLIYKNEAVFKWNILYPSSDGFMPFMDIVRLNWTLIPSFIFITTIFLLSIESKFKFKFKLLNNPLFFTGIAILAVSFLSSLKNGGNTNNIQTGFFYLIPSIFIFLKGIKFKNSLRIIVFLILFSNIPFHQVTLYKNYLAEKRMIELIPDKNYKILTDSNTYTLSRILINTKFPITNLNTFFFEKGYYGYYTYPKNFNPLDYDIVFIRDVYKDSNSSLSMEFLKENGYDVKKVRGSIYAIR